MELAGAIGRLEEVVDTCGSVDASADELRSALRATVELQSFIAARRAELVRSIKGKPGSFVEATIAETSGCSLGAASRETERVVTLDSAHNFADALSEGTITTDHVDALTRAGRQLDESQRSSLLVDQAELATVATSSTVRAFDEYLKRKVKGLRSESGEERLERQRRNNRLRTWIDGDDMFNVSGRFDPLTGVELSRCIRQRVEAMSADGTPDTAPPDPLERHQHLQALALASAVTGRRCDRADRVSNAEERVESSSPLATPYESGRRSRVDAIVVVDTGRSDGAGGPVVDWGIPVELPQSVLADVLGATTPDVVVVSNGIVLHAPGALNLGRSTRLANRAQRRALRGLYATCAVPGCAVHFDRCKLHHVIWWRHGGRTDLDNLLPVCQHHHTRIHEDGWVIELGERRELTIRLLDGHVMTTGPPNRAAA